MQQADAPCPECGYVMPAGVVVLTIPRTPRSKGAVAWQVLWIAGLTFMVATDPRGAVGAFSIFLVYLIQNVLQEAIRFLRIQMSPDAYTAQLWMSSEGMLFIPDADRDPLGRGVETTVSWLVSLLFVLSFWMQGTSKRTILILFGGSLLLFTVLPLVWRWLRRKRRTQSADTLRPEMLPWSRLNPIEIRPLKNGVSLKAETSHGPLTMPAVAFTLAGGPSVTYELAALVRRFAGDERVVMK